MRRLLILAALGSAFVLSACETSTPAPAPTIQVTAPAAPADITPIAPTMGPTSYPYPYPTP